MGATTARPYATADAMTSKTKVIAAELFSPRERWRIVAEMVTIITPTAAHDTSHGRMLVTPGSINPIAAITSSTPKKT